MFILCGQMWSGGQIITLFLLFQQIVISQTEKRMHSLVEMQTAKNIIVDHQDSLCKNKSGNIPLVIVVKTAAIPSGEYYERRTKIRQTWFKDAKKYSVPHVFAMGIPRSPE